MKTWREKIEKVFEAITFAEANCHEYAREARGTVSVPKSTLAKEPVTNQSFADAIGLKGIRVWYGVAEVA